MKQEKPLLRLKRPRRPDAAPSALPQAKPRRKARPQTPPPAGGKGPEDLLAALRAAAPALWDPDHPVPLAVGIHAQLYPLAARHGTSRRAVRRFLSRWTSSPAYLDALTRAGACRVNLDGSSAGPVSEQNRARAAQRISRRQTAARSAEAAGGQAQVG